jgi:gliding motility-associated-like protein
VEINVLDVPFIGEVTVNPESATTDGLPLGERIGLRVITDPEEPADVTYSWTANGESIGGNSSDIEHTPSDDPTVYEVTITTGDGCTVTQEVSINVVAPRYDIPNAFSPNDDNVNDFFNVVFVGGIAIVEFRIWNRWGELVYDNDTPETGWDGNINGDLAPSDVYVYKILIRFPDGQEFTEQGEITLIR